MCTSDDNLPSSNSKLPSPALEESLKSLSDNHSQWQTKVSVSDKLQLLQEMDRILSQEMSLSQKGEDFAALGEWTTETLMGIPLHTDEGKYNQTYEAGMTLLQMKIALDKLMEAYKMACGTNDAHQTHYEQNMTPRTTTTSTNKNQVVLPVFPTLPKHKFDFTAGLEVEWWLDPQHVSSIEQAPKPFDLEAFRDTTNTGVLLILGAGNQSFLTLIDVLDALFVRQRTVFLKHHPLRGPGLDPICRKLFRPLYEGHFLESCLDTHNLDTNSALVYHPKVTSVHMTGGKPTHDAIVWGSSAEEREINLQNNTPKLQAEMTSELGCITPWIMTSSTYTAKELQHHANMLINGVHVNASSNCLAPKVVVMDQHWPQRDEFLQLLQKTWETVELPVAYYPGCKQRWNAYKTQYPNASEWRDIHTNPNRPGKESVVLPLLCVDVKVDLSTEAGRDAARTECAFQNEPFCPVLTFVTVVQSKNNNNSFLETAVELCNHYIYGTLSCSLSVPQSSYKSPEVETMIANLEYGSIGVNVWTGMCYNFSWGGYAPVERLDKVESGIGRTGNFLFVPHVIKSVIRSPSIWANHPKPSRNYRQTKREFAAVAALVQAPSVPKVLTLFAALLRLPQMPRVGGVIGAAADTVFGVVFTVVNGLKGTMGLSAIKQK